MTPQFQTPLQRMLAIATALSVERDRWALHGRILDEVHAIAGAEGSTLYLLERGHGAPCLQPVIARNDALGWRWSPRDD